MKDIAKIKGDVARILAAVDRLTMLVLAAIQGEKIIMIDLTALQTSVEKNRNVVQSALIAFQGFQAMLNQAIKDALAAGASPAELEAIKKLATDLDASSQALADAVAKNTPAASPAPAP